MGFTLRLGLEAWAFVVLQPQVQKMTDSKNPRVFFEINFAKDGEDTSHRVEFEVGRLEVLERVGGSGCLP